MWAEQEEEACYETNKEFFQWSGEGCNALQRRFFLETGNDVVPLSYIYERCFPRRNAIRNNKSVVPTAAHLRWWHKTQEDALDDDVQRCQVVWCGGKRETVKTTDLFLTQKVGEALQRRDDPHGHDERHREPVAFPFFPIELRRSVLAERNKRFRLVQPPGGRALSRPAKNLWEYLQPFRLEKGKTMDPLLRSTHLYVTNMQKGKGHYDFGVYSTDILLDLVQLSEDSKRNSNRNGLSEQSSPVCNCFVLDCEWNDYSGKYFDPLYVAPDCGFSLVGILQKTVRTEVARANVFVRDVAWVSIVDATGPEKDYIRVSYTFYFKNLVLSPDDCQLLTKACRQEVDRWFVMFKNEGTVGDKFLDLDPHKGGSRGLRLLGNDRVKDDKPCNRPKVAYAVVLHDGTIVEDTKYPWKDFVLSTFRFRSPDTPRCSLFLAPAVPAHKHGESQQKKQISDRQVAHAQGPPKKLVFCFRDFPAQHLAKYKKARKHEHEQELDKKKTSRPPPTSGKTRSCPAAAAASASLSSKPSKITSDFWSRSEPAPGFSSKTKKKRKRLEEEDFYVKPVKVKKEDTKGPDNFLELFKDLKVAVPVAVAVPQVAKIAAPPPQAQAAEPSESEKTLMEWAAVSRKKFFKNLDQEATKRDKRFLFVEKVLAAPDRFGPNLKIYNATLFYRETSNTPVVQVSFAQRSCRCLNPKGRAAQGKPLHHNSERAYVDIDPWHIYLNCSPSCSPWQLKIPVPEDLKRVFFVQVTDLANRDLSLLTSESLMSEVAHLLQ
jgi:hypothetical protein